MHQVDVYNGALAVGTDYSEVVEFGHFHLTAWQFALYHYHASAGAATLTITNQYSYDKSTWVDGAEILSAGAKGSGIVAVDEATINKLFPMRYFRFKIEVAAADATGVFLSLGMA